MTVLSPRFFDRSKKSAIASKPECASKEKPEKSNRKRLRHRSEGDITSQFLAVADSILTINNRPFADGRTKGVLKHPRQTLTASGPELGDAMGGRITGVERSARRKQ